MRVCLFFLLCLINIEWPFVLIHSNLGPGLSLGLANGASSADLPGHTEAPWDRFAMHGTPFHTFDSSDASSSSPASSPLPSPFAVVTRLAFIADVDLRPQGAGAALLKLVAEEHVDATLMTGDNDYFQLGQERPERFGQRRTYPTEGMRELDRLLGKDHPVFAVMGNHEAESHVVFQPQPAYPDEPTYGAKWQSRMERLRLNDTCTGWIGGDSVCTLPRHDVLIVSSNVAVTDEPHLLAHRRREHEEYVAHALDRYGPHSRWRLCQWHVPADLLNTFNLPRSPQDDPGMKLYDICIKAGAIIITGHDHTYARTKSLRTPVLSRGSNGQDEVAFHGAPYYYAPTASRAELLVLSEGSSFAFVNGIGGQEIRSTHHGKHNAPHWARLKNALPDQRRGASPRDSAALLCTFGALAPPNILKGTPRTREGFIQAYGLPPEVSDRIEDLETQSGWCVLKTAEGNVEDEFVLLSVVSVATVKKAQPMPEISLKPEIKEEPAPSEPPSEIPIRGASSSIKIEASVADSNPAPGFAVEPRVLLAASIVLAIVLIVLLFRCCGRGKAHSPDNHIL